MEGLDRVLLVRGGGREVVTIYSQPRGRTCTASSSQVRKRTGNVPSVRDQFNHFNHTGTISVAIHFIWLNGRTAARVASIVFAEYIRLPFFFLLLFKSVLNMYLQTDSESLFVHDLWMPRKVGAKKTAHQISVFKKNLNPNQNFTDPRGNYNFSGMYCKKSLIKWLKLKQLKY